ncbi:MAG: hypothetical protein KAH31_07750 [Candidatus Sabulitectum sp.]|nr:hypothetical protein [Candidatus Sabulitectum sp.]
MKIILPVLASFLLLVSSCGERGFSQELTEDPDSFRLINIGSWSVRYDSLDNASLRYELSFVSTETAAQGREVDSLHFDSQLPDSLQFNMEWHVGGSTVLIFSVTIPDRGDEQLISQVRSVCTGASVVRPPGLRSIFLSDRTGSLIDSERASTAVEPPPDVTHHLMVYYQQDSTGSLLETIDSLVVNFTESNADSMAFTFIHRSTGSVISSTAGHFRRDSIQNKYLCFADSTGMYTGVFRNQFQINIPYLDSQGRVSVQSRLTSAYLSGDGYYPISVVPENYNVRVFLPDSISSWAPLLRGELPDQWYSAPGGIVGGLPIAIGNYTESQLFPRYRMLIFEGSPISPLDSIAVRRMASILRSTLDFPSAEFSFVEVINPAGPVVTSAFGGMLFSRGSLESLADVSAWDENFANGVIPPGSNILIGAAEGILMQSLQLDPILADMLASWIPVRYYAANTDNSHGLALIREAYLKFYLFNTEDLGGNGNTPVIAEHSLGDPMLNDSPLRPFVARGKGVVVMEYLYSLRMLNRLPYLLQDFTHASSGNFWLKVSSSLRVFRGTDKYDLLRALLYQPGIPQIQARWWEDNDKLFVHMTEIQPGLPFNLEFGECRLHFSDTTVVREMTHSIESGLNQCTIGLSGSGEVNAIDVNPTRVIPADIMYTRVRSGESE